MDTIELAPRTHHAGAFFARTPLMLIDGEPVPAASGETFSVFNPATGEKVFHNYTEIKTVTAAL